MTALDGILAVVADDVTIIRDAARIASRGESLPRCDIFWACEATKAAREASGMIRDAHAELAADLGLLAQAAGRVRWNGGPVDRARRVAIAADQVLGRIWDARSA